MAKEQSFLRNSWYVAALSSEVSTKPLARTITGEPIVLFRNTKNEVVALEDRCAHRQAPLSLGEVVGDAIQCGYHGFTFSSSGECIRVPSQERIPPNACIHSYPIIEKQGFIHIWTGNPGLENSYQPYNFPFAQQENMNSRYISLKGAFDYRLLIDNLMDLTHLGFTHRKTIGSEGVAENGKTKTERRQNGIRIVRFMEDIEPAPTHIEVTGYSGRVDRWQIIDFSPPCHVELHIGNAKTGTGGIGAAAENRLIDRRTLHVATPETETSTHYFWVSSYSADSMTTAQEDMIYQRTLEVLDEDIKMIEAQQLRLDPSRAFVDVNEDSGQLQTRQLISRLIQEENTPEKSD